MKVISILSEAFWCCRLDSVSSLHWCQRARRVRLTRNPSGTAKKASPDSWGASHVQQTFLVTH